MTAKLTNHKRTLNGIGLCLALFAVIGQLALVILNRQIDVFETIVRFFSYFTVLTNILVALYFLVQIFKFQPLIVLHKDSALTAITALILLVGLVYQFILRSMWQPHGFQMIIDEMLHSVIPLFVFLYWIFYAKHPDIKFKNLLIWLLYPFIYFVMVMIRGKFSGFYPYPFIDVSNIGYLKVFINFMILSIFVLMLMGALCSLARFFKQLKP